MEKLEMRKDRDVMKKVSCCRKKNPGIINSMEISTGESRMNEQEMKLSRLKDLFFRSFIVCSDFTECAFHSLIFGSFRHNFTSQIFLLKINKAMTKSIKQVFF